MLVHQRVVAVLLMIDSWRINSLTNNIVPAISRDFPLFFLAYDLIFPIEFPILTFPIKLCTYIYISIKSWNENNLMEFQATHKATFSDGRASLRFSTGHVGFPQCHVLHHVDPAFSSRSSDLGMATLKPYP